jgi:hypothetical protein
VIHGEAFLGFPVVPEMGEPFFPETPDNVKMNVASYAPFFRASDAPDEDIFRAGFREDGPEFVRPANQDTAASLSQPGFF